MTLALMVSYTPAIPEEIRSQVLFFTAGIVTLTLCVNATTMRWLLNKLGLIYTPTARTMMENKIQNHLHENSEKYFERLQTRDALNGANWKKVTRYIASRPNEQQNMPIDNDVMNEIRLRVLDKEKCSHVKFTTKALLQKLLSCYSATRWTNFTTMTGTAR